MATYSGGEAIVNVFKLSGSGAGVSTTVYTVPAGRYAKINIHTMTTNDDNSQGGFVKVGGAQFPTPYNVPQNSSITMSQLGLISGTEVQPAFAEMILTSGDTVQILRGSIIATVREFNNP